MSPEQCEGRATVDHRTDIYALGVVLYECLVGRVPFIGEGYGEILVQHLTQQPVPPSQYRMMSPHVEMVVLKALEKRADMRFPTMDEFMRAMGDPVGFVESHGGLTGFLQRQLMPSTAPLPPVTRLTPAPMTPIPGMMTPAPGTLTPGMGMTPTPTTLSAAAGQVQAPKSKTPFIIAAALVVVLAAGGVFMLLNKKKDVEPAAKPDEGSGAIAMDKGSQQQPPPPPPDNKGSAAASASGSADAKGSAAVENKGSAAGTMTVENKGSAEAKGSAEPKDVVSLSAVTITSNPPGAEILINGASIGKKTPATLNLPMGKDVNLALKLSGYADVKKALAVDKNTIAFDAPLRKVGGGGKGSGAGAGKGSAKGSGQKQCDTCLERPD
jgi:serine/threonine-protein kinase